MEAKEEEVKVEIKKPSKREQTKKNSDGLVSASALQ